MLSNNPYKSENLKLESSKVRIWAFFLILSLVYAIIVLIIITSKDIPDSILLYTIYSYAIIAPLFTYAIWLLLYYWKAKKWPQNEEIFGGSRQYLLLFLLMGICVITWAAYWNTGIFAIWMVIALIFYLFTNNELGAVIIYTVGAYAVTPAIVEELNKSLPSILAFFIVLQRGRDSEKKRKGMLGNEMNGFLIGMLIGLTFEAIETASYILSTILVGGTALDVYLQVTLRNWGPIHILGGSLGGYAAGKAERLRFESGEENLPIKLQIKKFLKIFIPIWLIPVSMHFLWNSSGVWIYLIFLLLNIQDEWILLLVIIIFQLILAIIAYIFLFIFYNRAQKAAEKTYRCPDTGIIVADKDVKCIGWSDILIKDGKEITESKTDITYNFCPICGIAISSTYNFCTNCGVNFNELKKKKPKPVKLYKSITMALLIISIIMGNLFIISSLTLFFLILILTGPIAWAIFFTQSIHELICAIIIIYATVTLLKLRKNYNGKKSMWGWWFLIYNLIGMSGALLFMSAFVLVSIFVVIAMGGAQVLVIILIILLPLIFVGGSTILAFLIIILKKEKQVLHYQRWY
ncbi:MAG: PrsW family glutamic-type intramembrane protease [Promethearchaeota archaeon]